MTEKCVFKLFSAKFLLFFFHDGKAEVYKPEEIPQVPKSFCISATNEDCKWILKGAK